MSSRDRSRTYLRFASCNKIVQIDRRDLIFSSTVKPFRQQTLTGRRTMTKTRSTLVTPPHFSHDLSYVASRTNIDWMRFFAAWNVSGNWLSGKLKSIFRTFADVCSSVSSRKGERPDRRVYMITPTDLKPSNDERIERETAILTRHRFCNAQERCPRSIPALRTPRFRPDDDGISSRTGESNHRNHRVSPDRNPHQSRDSPARRADQRVFGLSSPLTWTSRWTILHWCK